MSWLQWVPKVFLIVSIFLCLSISYAAEPEPVLQPLSITSKRMTVRNLDNVAIFDGNVVMTKADMRLTADHAEVTFGSSPSSDGADTENVGLFLAESGIGQNDVSMIHVTGHVVLEQAGKRAESDEAYYYQDEGRVVLIGDPTIFEKDYQVSGTKITVFLNEDRSLVEDSRVMIQPKKIVP